MPCPWNGVTRQPVTRRAPPRLGLPEANHSPVFGYDFGGSYRFRSGEAHAVHTRRLCWLVLTVALEFASSPARAATLSGCACADYQTAPEQQSYRGALLFASAEAAPGDLTIAAIRYNDSRVGPGVGAFANAGLGLASQLKLRAIVLRSVGETDYHAWRWRAGPEFRLPSQRT